MTIFKIVLISIVFSMCSSWASTFIPATISRQIEEATGAAEVELVSTRSYKNNSGFVSTEYCFKVFQLINLSNSVLVDGQLRFSLPGGTYEGMSSVVDGSPHFVLGEKNLVLIKIIKSSIYLSNFTMGKFSYKLINGEEFLLNEVFPNKINVGKIQKDEMYRLMNSIWSIETSENKSVKLINKTTENKIENSPDVEVKRTPAQELEKQIPLEKSKLLIFVLAFLGIIFSLYLLKIKNDEHK